MDAFEKLIAHLEGPPAVAQHKLAKRIKAQQSAVSLWRRRLSRPAAQFIPALNRILGTTLEEWLASPLATVSKPRRKKAA